jgi:hypothetical protein
MSDTELIDFPLATQQIDTITLTPSILYTRGSEQLKKSVEDDLATPDPESPDDCEQAIASNITQ